MDLLSESELTPLRASPFSELNLHSVNSLILKILIQTTLYLNR